MKKTIKSVLTFALALAIMVTCLCGTAFAASFDTITLGNHAATIRISTTTESAVATTRITGVTSAYTYAKATVYYLFDQDKCYTEASDAQTNGYAVATASVKRIPGEVQGGEGQHTIYYNDITWTPKNTETGKIYRDAIKV